MLSPEWITETVLLFVPLMLSLTVHEYAHARTALAFGDHTALHMGRVSLNPLVHLDPVGTLMLVITQRFGWAKPVPVNPYALERRSPAAFMWVSLAGPMSNLIMAVLAAIPFQLGLVSVFDIYGTNSAFLPSIQFLLFEFVYINLILMLFNLIPLYPLDGEKIAQYFFPPSWANFLDQIRPYSSMILLLVFIGLPFLGRSLGVNLNVVGWIMGPAMDVLLGLLIL